MSRAKLIFMTGKGGVGKTTLCTHLGQAAATQGLRTLIVEVNGSAQVPFIFNHPTNTYSITELQPNLSSISLTPEEAIEDYILKQIRSRRLYKIAFKNRFIQPLLNGAPGLHNAVQIGKIFELCCSGDWDIIFIDAPATGHGITMLDAARHMMELTQIGPLYEANKSVEEIISDPQHSGVVLICTPESLPVSECIELYERLPENRQTSVLATIINQYDPSQEALKPTSASGYGHTAQMLYHSAEERLKQAQWLKERMPIPIHSYPFQTWSYSSNTPLDAQELLPKILEGLTHA